MKASTEFVKHRKSGEFLNRADPLRIICSFTFQSFLLWTGMNGARECTVYTSVVGARWGKFSPLHLDSRLSRLFLTPIMSHSCLSTNKCTLFASWCCQLFHIVASKIIGFIRRGLIWWADKALYTSPVEGFAFPRYLSGLSGLTTRFKLLYCSIVLFKDSFCSLTLGFPSIDSVALLIE